MKKQILMIVAAFLILSASAQKFDQLAKTPPMGWNSWDSYCLYLNSKNALANMEVMAKKYLSSGYEYFVIDYGWYDKNNIGKGMIYSFSSPDPALDRYGVYEASPAYFPEGLKLLADKAHSLGLKFGLHLMRGIPRDAVKKNLPIKGTSYHAADIADTLNLSTWCAMTYGVDMSKPGAQEWYNSIFEKLAVWGIDFVKVDDLTPYPDEITAIERAIKICGRPMVYSLSPGSVDDMMHLPFYRKANMVRITDDIWDRRRDLDKAFLSWKRFQGTGFKGFWPDLDMIPFGQLNIETPPEHSEEPTTEHTLFSHWCRLSKDQMRTFITTRALAASPLFIGGDLLTMDDFSYSLLTNKNMLSCNRNGVMGTNIFAKDSIEIWHACDADQFGKGWIGVFNRSVKNKEQKFTKTELGLRKFFNFYQTIDMQGDIQVYDIWNDKYIDIKDGCSLAIPADGVIFLHYEIKNKK